MVWIQRNGKPVNAVQFGMGGDMVPGQRQEWDSKGAYYTVMVKNRKIRLSVGDWVCLDDDGAVIDVQSGNRFASEHVLDPSVQVEPKPVPPSPVIAVTTEDLEAEHEKLILDYAPDEPPVVYDPPDIETGKKRKPGRPKGAKNKNPVKVEVDPLEPL